MKKILITGSSGFVGSVVKKEFETAGYETIAWDLAEGKDVVDLIKSDLVPDYICHLAAVGDIYKVNEDPVRAYIANIIAVAQLMEYAKKTGAKIIHASTWECYSDNITHYIASKKAAELVIAAYKDVSAVIFRLGTVYGENMRSSSVFNKFIDKAKNNNDLQVFGSGQYRQFVNVNDVARAFKKAVEGLGEWTGQTYNIVGKEKIFIADMAKYIADKFGVKLVTMEAREEPQLIELNCDNGFGFVPEANFWQELDRLCKA